MMDRTFNSREEAALFLMNGDEEKAYALLNLIGEVGLPYPPEEFNREMRLPEETCHYCTDDGECWYHMPDSMFKCGGKCENFAEKELRTVDEATKEAETDESEIETTATEEEAEVEKE